MALREYQPLPAGCPPRTTLETTLGSPVGGKGRNGEVEDHFKPIGMMFRETARPVKCSLPVHSCEFRF